VRPIGPGGWAQARGSPPTDAVLLTVRAKRPHPRRGINRGLTGATDVVAQFAKKNCARRASRTSRADGLLERLPVLDGCRRRSSHDRADPGATAVGVKPHRLTERECGPADLRPRPQWYLGVGTDSLGMRGRRVRRPASAPRATRGARFSQESGGCKHQSSSHPASGRAAVSGQDQPCDRRVPDACARAWPQPLRGATDSPTAIRRVHQAESAAALTTSTRIQAVRFRSSFTCGSV
jgi:hypothetical protein